MSYRVFHRDSIANARASPSFGSPQNIIYVSVNIPDIKAETLKYDLTPTTITFSAQEGK